MRAGKRPKLGQHFLHDPAYRRRILQSLPLRAEDMVVEIGPGRGAMTNLLAERASKVVAIEIDPALVAYLRAVCAEPSRVIIISRDFLAVDLEEILRQQGSPECFVFGNLPYYITSPILHHLFDLQAYIRAMGLLVQQEVAERLTAQPCSRAYGYLTVSAQLHWQPRIALEVPPGAFSPPPAVHSALVIFSRNPQWSHWTPGKSQQFLDFVKRCFAQKRKNLLNNLGPHYLRERVEQALAAVGKGVHVRAEQLPVEELASIYGHLTSWVGNGTRKIR